MLLKAAPEFFVDENFLERSWKMTPATFQILISEMVAPYQSFDMDLDIYRAEEEKLGTFDDWDKHLYIYTTCGPEAEVWKFWLEETTDKYVG